MNILIITPVCPYPATNGAAIRVAQISKALSQHHRVTLCSLVSNDLDLNEVYKELEPIYYKVKLFHHGYGKAYPALRWLFSDRPYRHVKMYNKQLHKAVIENYRDNDVIYANFLESSQYLEQISDKKMVLDQHNDDVSWFEKFKNSANPLLSWFGSANIRRLHRCSSSEYGIFDFCISVSTDDVQSTKSYITGKTQFIIAPNGVDSTHFNNSNKVGVNQDTILFCGAMDATMNQDAALWFAEEVLPIIQESNPCVKFIVVGRNPPAKVRNLGRNNSITVTGTVDDVVPYYRSAGLVVLPFHYGGGSKLKLFEAMAMGIPVVSTDVGQVGVEPSIGKYLHIANKSREFANQCVELIRQGPGENEKILKELVVDQYSWEVIGEKLNLELFGNDCQDRKEADQ